MPIASRWRACAKASRTASTCLPASGGLFSKALLPRDPTGEFMQLLDAMGSGHRPQTVDGAWFSRDGQRALLLARTRAEGADTDGQSMAVVAIRAAFEAVSKPGMCAGADRPRPLLGDGTCDHQDARC